MKNTTRRMCKKAVPVLSVLMTTTFALGSAGLLNTTRALAETADSTKYYSDFTSLDETLAAGAELNVELASEGNVLLKNNGALPFGANTKKLSVFGVASTSLQTGGGGSGSGSGIPNTVKESLEDAGFIVNPTLWTYYTAAGASTSSGWGGSSSTLEPEVSKLNPYVGSYSLYDDAAIVMIKRTGSEGSDLARSNVSGHKNKEDHYLMLDDNEKALLEHVKDNFDKVIVIINSSNAMELGDLEDDDEIDGILWIGHTGNTGIMALGKILNGEVNPSGRLVDVYAANFKQDPTWYNFGDMSQLNPVSSTEQGGPGGPGGPGGGRSIEALAESGSTGATETYDNIIYKTDENGNYIGKYLSATGFGASDYYSSVEYREGIYEGYRWYETAATVDGYYKATASNMPNNKYATYDVSDAYYNRDNGVVYSFGYGLSYTTFEYSNFSVSGTDAKDGVVTVKVRVTNSGSVAGKEVVQVYSDPQYNGTIEKAAANLITFAKTDLLQPGEYQDVELSFDMQDLASFDYNDANGNGFVGYEIEAGTYKLSVRSDSHNIVVDNNGNRCESSFTVPEDSSATADTYTGWTYSTDADTGNAISAVLSNGDRYDSLLGYYDENGEYTYRVEIGDYVTRKNFALPTGATQEERAYGNDLIEQLDSENVWYAYNDKTTDPWYKTADDVQGWTQAADDSATPAISAADMRGVDYNDESAYTINGKTYESGAAAWQAFLNQFTYEEFISIITGGRGTPALERFGIPSITHNDGPAQLGNGTFWVSEVVIASTWNVDLAEKQGQIVGNESLFQNTTGWWGPGFNTHRSPFGGRNFEYYSSDGVQGGMIGAAVIKGALSKGVQTYLKHCVVNDQETDREAAGGVLTIVSEQALREIYLKTFELAIKAGANAVMTSFNRIGRAQASSNSAILNDIIRGEWGQEISVITDMYNPPYTYPDLFVRNGGVLALAAMNNLSRNMFSGVWSKDDNCVLIKADANAETETVKSYTQWYWIRTAAQRALYVAINSNGMDNCYDLTSFTGGELGVGETCVVGLSYSKDISSREIANQEQDVSYAIVDGKLPAGLALSESGVISGTPQEAGTYSFDVQVTLGYWNTKTVTFTINVTEAFEIDADASAKVGEEYEAEFTTDYFKTTADGGEYDTVEFVGSNLPEGLSVEDGLLYGKPAEAGTYDITVTLVATKTVQGSGSQGNQQQTDRVSRTFTLVVEEADVVVPTKVLPKVTLNLNGGTGSTSATVNEDGTVKVPAVPTREGYVFTGWYLDEACSAVASFQATVTSDVTYYAGWEEVVVEAAEETSDGGCNGSIETGLSVIAGLVLVAGVVVVCKVAKRKNETK